MRIRPAPWTRPRLLTAALSGLAACALLLPAGLLSLVFREPLLFPSLGPTVFIQVHAPRSEAARPWNNLAGHAIGVLCAVIALWVTGAAQAHTAAQVSQPLVTWRRELAGVLAVGLTTGAQGLLGAAQAPAAATALLIALGAITPEWRAIGVITAGVVSTVAMERLLRPWLLWARSIPDERA